jgi:glycerophosphoryl diester phosphodiesterase
MGPAAAASLCASRSEAQPFLVAHRAGNDIRNVSSTPLPAGWLAEADLRIRRGRVEVRHLKAAGPLPLLWDRWRIAPAWRHRLPLRELLAVTTPQLELVLDLKGRRRLLAELVRAEISEAAARPLTICARDWRLLELFHDLPVRRIASVGTASQLAWLLARGGSTSADGVSIHERLLDASVVAALRERVGPVLTWPVNRPERARELLRYGVTGLITDAPHAIAPCLAEAR